MTSSVASTTAWAPDDVGDLTGRTAVVTGANSGVGLEVSRALAAAGAHVVLASRDPHRGDEALGRLRVQVPGCSVELVPLDLADLSSVRSCARAVAATHPAVDLLVNNAGVMAVPRRRTADGFELQLGTNHLGHFALTGLLLPTLVAAGAQERDVRVVTVSSLMHRVGRLDRPDLMHERRYRRWRVYAQSKLANLLFALELQRRLEDAGAPVVSVAAHPGVPATNLVASGPMSGLGPVGRALSGVTTAVLAPAAHGAWPVLRAATDPDVQGGEYFGPGLAGETRGAPVQVGTTAAAQDPGDAAWLWRTSEQLTGVRYGLPGAGDRTAVEPAQ